MPQNVLRACDVPFEEIEGLDKNDIYIYDVYYYNNEMWRAYGDNGKLPSKEALEYIVPAGGFRYNQIYFNNLLKKIGLENPMTALMEERVYFIGDEIEVEYIKNYLEEHYNVDIEVEKRNEERSMYKFITKDQREES